MSERSFKISKRDHDRRVVLEMSDGTRISFGKPYITVRPEPKWSPYL